MHASSSQSSQTRSDSIYSETNTLHRPSLDEARFSAAAAFGYGSNGAKDDVVPVGFDEAVLRGLCEMDVSFPRRLSLTPTDWM